jgi:ferredoxin like protein
MGNFLKDNSSPLNQVTINPDTKSHISIRDKEVCREDCENKPCTYYCPTRVYSWQDETEEIKIDYTRCIECLACPYGCPYNNIHWQFPRGGYGVDYTD